VAAGRSNNWGKRTRPACAVYAMKGVVVRVFANQRGSVASELSFGVMVVGILVLAGLYMMAQVEGVSFTVLLHQLRHH
jgi:hypothetical protein